MEGIKLIIKSMIWNIRKKNIESEQQEEKRIQKTRSLWDIFKSANIWITGVPVGEEIEKLFEKVMKENIPDLVKEIVMQVQETEGPKQDGPKEDHTKTHHN